MERKTATRELLHHLSPIGEHRERLPFTRVFTDAEYDLLTFGLIPNGMDDKWFIFLENDWMYFHRSWTGRCVFQLRLERVGDCFHAQETWIDLDALAKVDVDLVYESSLIAFLIDNLLLGKSSPFPS